MKRKIVFFIPILFFTLVLLGFWYLGGLDRPAYEVVTRKSATLIGTYYEGDWEKDYERYEELQAEINEKWKSGVLSGMRAVYFLNNPDTAKVVKAYVGVMSDQKPPSDYKAFEIPKRKIVRGAVNTHPLIAPSPQEIFLQLSKFAREQGVTIEMPMLEKYSRDGGVIIEVEAKE